MRTYDAEATRARLLEAAAAEFAARGFAGARTERIAAAARSNKAQIHHYFGSKAALFEVVFARAVGVLESEVPFDVQDLPGYAGRLAALHERRPEILRLCTWQRLERADDELNPEVVAYARQQVEAVRDAQEAGQLPADLPPGFVLGFVLHMATSWPSASLEYDAAIGIPAPDERARLVEASVRRLLAPRERGLAPPSPVGPPGRAPGASVRPAPAEMTPEPSGRPRPTSSRR